MTSAIITMLVLAGAPAPLITKNHKLACPQGTTQVAKPSKLACSEGMKEGLPVLHGPVIVLQASGKVEAVGQAEHGMRSGNWSFYDEAGVLVGETEFKNGDFDGRRVFYTADGKVKSEERYSAGKLVTASAPTGTQTPATSTRP